MLDPILDIKFLFKKIGMEEEVQEFTQLSKLYCDKTCMNRKSPEVGQNALFGDNFNFNFVDNSNL